MNPVHQLRHLDSMNNTGLWLARKSSSHELRALNAMAT